MQTKPQVAERPILKGKQLTLRSPQESDKQDRLACGLNSEFRKMVGADLSIDRPYGETQASRWYETIRQEPFHWVIESEGKCIGSARLHSLDQKNRRARYAIGIFDPMYWNRGLGTETTCLILQYAFEIIHLHRVDLRVLAFNHRAIACYKKCGFVQEGIEREGAFIGGEWQSDVVMSILEQEYKVFE